MAGSYSSELQHKKDTVNYFDIRLQIIPIWKENKNGFWFYVEQAVSGSIDKPYRQRVYHLTEKNGVFESAVYTLNNPLRFTHNAPLCEKTLTPDSLKEREGCAVILHRKNENTFEGSTVGHNCPSERQGAAYATAEVIISNTELRSWDRGFNSNGEQVWGAKKGGYIFIKQH